jgi:hypothetical protein
MTKSSKDNKKVETKVNAKAKAGKILAKAPETKVFWCNDGQIFRDLDELAEGLNRMSDETFTYHCNDSKNDFSIWVLEVIGDDELAGNLRASRNRQQAHKRVKQRYSDLTRLEG